MSIQLSNRTFPLLAEFADGKRMSEDDARTYDQRPFRALLLRGFVAFDHSRALFHITDEGRKAWKDFGDTPIGRKNCEGPLCAYFRLYMQNGRGHHRGAA